MQEKSYIIDNQSEKISFTAQVFADLLRFSGKNARQFALETGISEEQLSKFLKGKRKSVTDKVAERVLEHYPQISRVWLLTGEGDMLKSVRVEGCGNATVNGDHSTATIGVDGSRLLDQLDRKDEQIRNATEQVNRLLAIIERMQGA